MSREQARFAPSDATTLTAVLSAYADEGFGSTLWVTENGELSCSECNQFSSPTEAELLSLRRLEGASDPDDMVAVLALRCPRCDTGATSVVHFGPAATPAENEVLRLLQDRRGEGELGAARPGPDAGPGTT